MGLFRKFRSDEKRPPPSPKLATSGPNGKPPLTLDSSGDTSEFSLATSQLSHSSQDTKRQLEIQGKRPIQPQNGHTTAQNQHLHSNPASNAHSVGAGVAMARHLLQPRVSPNYHYQGQNTHYAGQTGQNGQNDPQSMLPRGRASMPPPAPSTGPTSPAGVPRPRVSHLASTSMLSTVPMPFYPAAPEEAYTSGSADTSAELLEEEEARHPYYDQWKQYYAAMAGHPTMGRPGQNMYLPPMSQLSSRRASFAGYTAGFYQGGAGQNGLLSLLTNSHSHSSIANINNYPGYGTANPAGLGYMQYYHSHEGRKENGLVRNSRMLTLKLNRLSSAPSLAQGMDLRAPKPRAISVNVAAPENQNSDQEDQEELEAIDPPRPSLLAANAKSVSFGLLGLSLEPYTAPLPPPPPVHKRNQSYASESDSSVLLATDEKPEPSIAREDSAISDYGKYLFNTTLDSTEEVPDQDQDQGAVNNSLDLLDPGVRAALSAPDEEPPHAKHHNDTPVSRNDSVASNSSYNSLQSESNFSVGRRPTRIASQSEQQRRLSRRQRAERKFSKLREFVPPMPGPPPPIYAGRPGMPPSPSSMTAPPQMLPYGASTDNISPEGAAFQLQKMQQQIQQLQQLQQQQLHMSMYQGNPRNSRVSLSPQPQQLSSDPVINAKIEEFVKLRQTIASGNKTFDFRLKWAKMLITAVNYKLYAYINIKGDSIPSEQAAMNKLTFVKLAVTHLQKMLKELDVEKHTPQDRRIFAEVCYIHGCLLMHDYTVRFEQDFNIQQDKDEADRFFRKCLELNPLFFRAHYKLAELFEEDRTEESFDTALYHYTQAAKLGYNRAIYQIALIYLTVPKVRLLKYFRYLKSLSDIDMDSKDIKLGPEDRAELEEISGLASFQLAKIYEGIYPGDLAPEDEFVQKSLEFAPVNYAKSLSYYNRAARLHCLQAQVRLGHIYENGDLNRKHNPNKSVSWFIKAATSPLKFKRHPEAMLGLSRWFIIGTDGMNKHIPYPDPQGAVMWAERACKEFNFPEAFFAMGQFAEQGLAPGDPQEWYTQAYELGFAEAAAKLPGYQPPEPQDMDETNIQDAYGEDLTYTEGPQENQNVYMESPESQAPYVS